uniref:G-protein coupled receptors family 1 profile domain-containing protein n=1 Tax=Periophthalmus magnuspinnatus TaxID=409849 RepID=A0A3B4A7G7_9GOBI
MQFLKKLNLTRKKTFFSFPLLRISCYLRNGAVSGLRTLVPVGLMSLCFLVGIPGNIAVLILRPNWQKLSRLTQCLMMNLALSDLLCLITLPIWIYAVLYNWALGITTCKMLGFVMHCSIFSSVLTITALSVQRYMQVVHPQRCIQFKKRLLVLMWLISMIFSIPMLVVRQIMKVNQKNIDCILQNSSDAQLVTVLLTECFFGISSFTITTCAYILLNRKLNQAIFFNNPSTIKLVTTIIVTFFVFWMPYLIFNFVTIRGILSNNLNIISFYYSNFNIFASLTFINSTINPLLYAFASGLCQTNRNLQQCAILLYTDPYFLGNHLKHRHIQHTNFFFFNL